jgi:hypothetical protein
VPFDCVQRQQYGPDICLTECPANEPRGGCAYVRVEAPEHLPPADPSIIDVAVLDMHHGWPNLGHDSIVHAVQTAVCDLQEPLAAAGVSFRVISYDVRQRHQIPDSPPGRHAIYVGTGGPGHLDPRRNDGESPGSQGILERPDWEPRLFELFDAIRASDEAVLLAVCHTFGVMCRWLGIADAVLRGPEKGGKSTGILENLLTAEGAAHPWFAQFARELPDRRRFRVLDNRLYDLIPHGDPIAGGVTPIAHDTHGIGGPPGEALTMLEVARDPGGTMPRIFGVNHHPEIVNRPRQLTILRKKLDRGEVSAEWYAERSAALTQDIDARGDLSLQLTASYTFLAPLRHYLQRAAVTRALALGRELDLDERHTPLVYKPSSSAAQSDKRG